MEREIDFLSKYSPDNIIRQALAVAPPQYEVPTGVEMPPPYMPTMPQQPQQAQDWRNSPQVPQIVRSAGATLDGRQDGSNAALQAYFPKQAKVNPNWKMPVAGRDVPLPALTQWIRARESSGNYTALNREQKGNTASGAYQYTDATWNNYGGYPKAMLAPKEVQDRRFREDIMSRFRRHGGDPFKMIAEHYLPAAAKNPATWTRPYKLPSGKTVKPVASYVAYVVKGTPLEADFREYLARH